MMVRTWKKAGALLLMLALLVSSTVGCFQNSEPVWNESMEDGKSAYELAVENGYVGTLEEWLADLQGSDGKTGVGIETVEYDNGDLIIVYTDGTRENIGPVVNINDPQSEDYEFYRLSDGTYGILSCKLTDRKTLELPAVYQGRAVTEIFDHAFENDTVIEAVVIPSTVKSIGNNAFSGCTSLKSVTIPSSVTAIDANAFSGCTSLTSVELEDPNEWRANGILLEAEHLSDPNQAAAAFTEAYANTAWRCIRVEGSVTVIDVVNEVEDAVVVINATIISNSFFGTSQISTSAGSGVIVSSSGYILTCNHVVDGATAVEVKLNSGASYTAEIVGCDAASDIAVLKIDAETALTAVELGSSSSLVVGETVVAIGNPLGTLDGTVTSGIISATERTITMSDGTSMTLLQTDAAVNSGNSGGGLFNLRGELIGIVNAKYAQTGVEGLAFAIPIDWANEVKQDLIEYGYVRGILDSGLSTLDVTAANLSEYNRRFGIAEVGVYVVSSKYTTDLVNKDRIISVNGVEVNTTEELKVEIEKYEIGDVLTIQATRSGSPITASLTIREYVPDGVTAA